MSDTLAKSVKTLSTIKAFAVERGYFYFNPLVNFTEEEIILEWWLSNKKLSLYINTDKIEYFQTCQTTIMDGQVKSPEKLKELWGWLTAEETEKFDLPVAALDKKEER